MHRTHTGVASALVHCVAARFYRQLIEQMETRVRDYARQIEVCGRPRSTVTLCNTILNVKPRAGVFCAMSTYQELERHLATASESVHCDPNGMCARPWKTVARFPCSMLMVWSIG